VSKVFCPDFKSLFIPIAKLGLRVPSVFLFSVLLSAFHFLFLMCVQIIAPTPLIGIPEILFMTSSTAYLPFNLATNFIILGRLITLLGEEYSRLRPKFCSYNTSVIIPSNRLMHYSDSIIFLCAVSTRRLATLRSTGLTAWLGFYRADYPIHWRRVSLCSFWQR